MLHYTTHCTAPRTTLHYTTLHYTTLQITLHYITLHYITHTHACMHAHTHATHPHTTDTHTTHKHALIYKAKQGLQQPSHSYCLSELALGCLALLKCSSLVRQIPLGQG